MQRRSFLAGILAAGFAPAAIGSGVLMPTRQIWTLTPGLRGGKLWLPGGRIEPTATGYRASAAECTFTAVQPTGPFRYVLVYDERNGEPIAQYNYGREVVLAPTETFTICASSDGGGRTRPEVPPESPLSKWYESV